MGKSTAIQMAHQMAVILEEIMFYIVIQQHQRINKELKLQAVNMEPVMSEMESLLLALLKTAAMQIPNMEVGVEVATMEAEAVVIPQVQVDRAIAVLLLAAVPSNILLQQLMETG